MLLLILFLLGPSSGTESGKTRACDVLMVIDSPLFELYDKNMSAVVELAQDHINGLNEIFFKELFVDDYQSLYFFLKRVQVAFGSCDSPLFEEGYDSNCTTQRGNYLKNFDDKTDTHEFCLAYMLTYLDFHNGTAGLGLFLFTYTQRAELCRAAPPPIQNNNKLFQPLLELYAVLNRILDSSHS